MYWNETKIQITGIIAFVLVLAFSSCFSVKQVSTDRFDNHVKYETTKTEKAKGVAIIVHGLNLKPEKMTDLIKLLKSLDYHTINVVLKGHDGNIEDFSSVTSSDWLKDFEQAYSLARQISENENIPLVFLGFSIGALTGLCYQEISGSAVFDKTILFAPAIETNSLVGFSRIFFIFKNSIMIRSAQNKDYRVFPGTSVAAYKALFTLMDQFHEKHDVFDKNEALIIIDKKDELVSKNRIIQNYNTENKNIIILDRNKKDMAIKHHHLLIDEKSLGPDLWKEIVSVLTEYLGNNL